MAGLISPRPLSYLQHNLSYNPYQRTGTIGYSDSASGGLHTPDQSLVPFVDGSPAAALAMHEEQKIYNLVVDLLDPSARESALLELSKKREQFDELALVLWHSFGTPPLSCSSLFLAQCGPFPLRYYARSSSGDCFRLSSALAANPHCARLKPRLQCLSAPPVRRFPHRYTTAIP